MNIEIVGREKGHVAMFAIDRFIHLSFFQNGVASRASNRKVFEGFKKINYGTNQL
jgi:hypothetical protein